MKEGAPTRKGLGKLSRRFGSVQRGNRPKVVPGGDGRYRGMMHQLVTPGASVRNVRPKCHAITMLEAWEPGHIRDPSLTDWVRSGGAVLTARPVADYLCTEQRTKPRLLAATYGVPQVLAEGPYACRVREIGEPGRCRAVQHAGGRPPTSAGRQQKKSREYVGCRPGLANRVCPRRPSLSDGSGMPARPAWVG